MQPYKTLGIARGQIDLHVTKLRRCGYLRAYRLIVCEVRGTNEIAVHVNGTSRNIFISADLPRGEIKRKVTAWIKELDEIVKTGGML